MKKFLGVIFAFIVNSFKPFRVFVKNNAASVIEFMHKVREVIENPVLDLLTHLTATEFDDKFLKLL